MGWRKVLASFMKIFKTFDKNIILNCQYYIYMNILFVDKTGGWGYIWGYWPLNIPKDYKCMSKKTKYLVQDELFQQQFIFYRPNLDDELYFVEFTKYSCCRRLYFDLVLKTVDLFQIFAVKCTHFLNIILK